MPPNYHVLLNARAGTALGLGITKQQLTELFEDAGLSVVVDDDMHLPMAARLERIRSSSAEIIVAAGGDGTVTAVASALVDSPKLLAILPLGTVNALARDMGVPAPLKDWVAQLGEMQPRQIDVGEVNGQIFLHKVVAGFVPGIATARELVRGGGVAAKWRFVRFFFRRLLHSRRIAVVVADPDGTTRIRRVVAIAVANNEYDEGLGRVFSRSQFDRGTLGVYLLKHLNIIDFLRLTVEMLVGKWQNDEAIEIETAKELTLRTKRRQLKVMLDGEVQSLTVPLNFRIRPLALSILAPAAVETDAAPAAAIPA